MASVTSVAFTAIGQSTCERKVNVPSTRHLASNFKGLRFRTSVLCHCVGVRASTSTSRMVIQCVSTGSGELYTSFLLSNMKLISILCSFGLNEGIQIGSTR